MRYDQEVFDMTSIGVVAIVAIVAVSLIVFSIGEVESPISLPEQPVGNAVDYGNVRVPVKAEFSREAFDFNHDGMLDIYDFEDVLTGRAACDGCDLNADGYIDGRDKELFISLLRRVYDYNNNQKLDREDPLYLREILLGNRQCDSNHICDIDGDGFVSSRDLTKFTSLIYNYDAPVIA